VKLRVLWRKIDLKLRPPLLQGHAVDRPIDAVDAMTTMSGLGADSMGQGGPADAPPNWVPSQQDWGRPRH
jgi:hypothetical protein